MSTNPLLAAKPRRVKVTIYDGDLERELEALLDRIGDLELEAESDKRKKQMALDLAAEHDAKVAEATGVEIVLQAIPEVRARQLQDECPARKGNQKDEMWGFDIDAFLDRLVPAMRVQPDVTDEQWAEFREQVTPEAWGRLKEAAFDLFTSGVDLGKSSVVSLLHRRREHDSKPSNASA